MHCTNNLKQIGLAMHSFATAQDTFPPGIKANIVFSSSASDYAKYVPTKNASGSPSSLPSGG